MSTYDWAFCTDDKWDSQSAHQLILWCIKHLTDRQGDKVFEILELS